MYTREQAEQVLKDYDEFHKCTSKLATDYNQEFLDAKFPKLKNGMWVKWKYGGVVYITDLENNGGYGVTNIGNWRNNKHWVNFNDENYQPATNEEVIEALENYAQSIGLVEGARVKCFADNKDYILSGKKYHNKYVKDGYFWMYSTNKVSVQVMENGEWATPIKSDLHDKLEELKKQAEAEGMKLVVTFENK